MLFTYSVNFQLFQCWVSRRYACAFAIPQNLPERPSKKGSVYAKQIRMKKPEITE